MLLEHGARGGDPFQRRFRQHRAAAEHRDVPDVVGRQVVARELDRREPPRGESIPGVFGVSLAALTPSSSRSSSTRAAPSSASPSAGAAAASAAPAGSKPTSSPPRDLHAVRARLGLDPRDDLVQRCGRQSSTFMLTCTRRARQLEPERPHAGKPAARLADDSRDRARDLDVRRRELDVEGDERRARADEDGASRIEPRRSKSAWSSPASMRPWSASGPAAPEEGRPPALADCAVEEHGQPQLLAHALRQRQRGPFCALQVVGDHRGRAARRPPLPRAGGRRRAA